MVLGIGAVHADPPFVGTVWVDPDIITRDDPTTFQSLAYMGRGNRLVFDGRRGDWDWMSVLRFEARFEEGRHVEIWVNPEFDRETARGHADAYARIFGRLPAVLRDCVQAIEIHGGDHAGGNDVKNRVHMNTTILSDSDHRKGFIEEVLVHEAGHACEAELRGTPHSPEWLDAQDTDPEFISEYAREHPRREDFAETLLNWIAVRYRPERVDAHYPGSDRRGRSRIDLPTWMARYHTTACSHCRASSHMRCRS